MPTNRERRISPAPIARDRSRFLLAKASYAKSARAGKDVGKRGKNFSKIESKAAKRYGSKEAGKRVAGAALAKLPAKKK